MNFIQKQLLNIAIKSGVISLDNSNNTFYTTKWFGNNYSFGGYKNDTH